MLCEGMRACVHAQTSAGLKHTLLEVQGLNAVGAGRNCRAKLKTKISNIFATGNNGSIKCYFLS